MSRVGDPVGFAVKTILLPSGEKSGKVAGAAHVGDLLLVGAVLLHRPDLDGAAALARAVGDPPTVGRVGGAGVEAGVGGQAAQVLPVRARRVDIGVPVDVDPEGDPPVRRAWVGGAGGPARGGQSCNGERGCDRRDGKDLGHVFSSSFLVAHGRSAAAL